MKVFGFLNNKGGVGKTATAISVASILAQKYGKRVLLVDLDPQGNSTSMFCETNPLDLLGELLMGNTENYKERGSVEQLLLDQNYDIHKCIISTKIENLFLIPAFLTLAECEERLKADVRTPQQFRLKKQLEKVQGEYDYVILDYSPSVNIININGLAASDYVYVPARCDAWSVVGFGIAKNLIETVQDYNPKLKIGGILFTDWKRNKNVSKQILEMSKTAFGDVVIPVQITSSKLIEEMSYLQKTILELDPTKKNRVTRDYADLTEYIYNQIGE